MYTKLRVQSAFLQHGYTEHGFAYPRFMFCDTCRAWGSFAYPWVVQPLHPPSGRSTHPRGTPPSLELLNFLEHGFVEHIALREGNTRVQAGGGDCILSCKVTVGVRSALVSFPKLSMTSCRGQLVWARNTKVSDAAGGRMCCPWLLLKLELSKLFC